MNKKVGMYASIITFLGALCFSIFILLDHNTFRIGNHLSCILIALGFIGMICAYVTFVKDENKSISLISFAFSIIYAIIILILCFIWIIPYQYSNLSSEADGILHSLEILGYTFMAISSFFIGIKLEANNKSELFLKILFCFQILFSVMWFVLLITVKNYIYLGKINSFVWILMFEIWCVYIILICIFSYLYFKNK